MLLSMDGASEDRSNGASEPSWMRSIDPLILAAAREVDVALIDWALSLSPTERLRACTRATAALGRFADAASVCAGQVEPTHPDHAA
jgi:hypothetical protein